MRLGTLGLAALGMLAVVPASASAVTLGETFPPEGCVGDTTYIQTESPGDAYTVPFPGVITSWSYEAADAPPAQMKLKVAQAAGGDNFTVVGESELEDITPNSLNTFPTQVRVDTGDLLGHYMGVGAVDEQCSRPDADFTDVYLNDDVFPGETELFTEESFQLDISAELKPYRCEGKKATIAGTAGNDRLKGTRRNDVIVGLNGKDKIKGGKGKDRICGGKGKDKLKGGPGKDKLDGGPGKDKEVQ